MKDDLSVFVDPFNGMKERYAALLRSQRKILQKPRPPRSALIDTVTSLLGIVSVENTEVTNSKRQFICMLAAQFATNTPQSERLAVIVPSDDGAIRLAKDMKAQGIEASAGPNTGQAPVVVVAYTALPAPLGRVTTVVLAHTPWATPAAIDSLLDHATDSPYQLLRVVSRSTVEASLFDRLTGDPQEGLDPWAPVEGLSRNGRTQDSMFPDSALELVLAIGAQGGHGDGIPGLPAGLPDVIARHNYPTADDVINGPNAPSAGPLVNQMLACLTVEEEPPKLEGDILKSGDIFIDSQAVQQILARVSNIALPDSAVGTGVGALCGPQLVHPTSTLHRHGDMFEQFFDDMFSLTGGPNQNKALAPVQSRDRVVCAALSMVWTALFDAPDKVADVPLLAAVELFNPMATLESFEEAFDEPPAFGLGDLELPPSDLGQASVTAPQTPVPKVRRQRKRKKPVAVRVVSPVEQYRRRSTRVRSADQPSLSEPPSPPSPLSPLRKRARGDEYYKPSSAYYFLEDPTDILYLPEVEIALDAADRLSNMCFVAPPRFPQHEVGVLSQLPDIPRLAVSLQADEQNKRSIRTRQKDRTRAKTLWPLPPAELLTEVLEGPAFEPQPKNRRRSALVTMLQRHGFGVGETPARVFKPVLTKCKAHHLLKALKPTLIVRALAEVVVLAVNLAQHQELLRSDEQYARHLTAEDRALYETKQKLLGQVSAGELKTRLEALRLVHMKLFAVEQCGRPFAIAECGQTQFSKPVAGWDHNHDYTLLATLVDVGYARWQDMARVDKYTLAAEVPLGPADGPLDQGAKAIQAKIATFLKNRVALLEDALRFEHQVRTDPLTLAEVSFRREREHMPVRQIMMAKHAFDHQLVMLPLTIEVAHYIRLKRELLEKITAFHAEHMTTNGVNLELRREIEKYNAVIHEHVVRKTIDLRVFNQRTFAASHHYYEAAKAKYQLVDSLSREGFPPDTCERTRRLHAEAERQGRECQKIRAQSARLQAELQAAMTNQSEFRETLRSRVLPNPADPRIVVGRSEVSILTELPTATQAMQVVSSFEDKKTPAGSVDMLAVPDLSSGPMMGAGVMQLMGLTGGQASRAAGR
ncbi:hypothetical protein J8273_6576 [Carpediemonas membranifera]|uniref:CHD C-terminal 2 domain-containing protein n=1 Tax=Carpediemonas membranifera TaxID=201153 RepID=A0A8J6B7S7_9EUKA|nr:hypothetical protein J8273_6576 [Carpediemonas membranifera]|eukprot:KAG9391797.1 hypothetical protein J8273_6576 [Carpediemonas membranifera]